MSKQTHENENADLDLVWGAEAIGRVINLPRAKVFYLLREGRLPATKVGELWCASRSALRKRLVGDAA